MTTFAPYHFSTSELISIEDLGQDDIVEAHGAIFRIVTKEVVGEAGGRPVYRCTTETIDGGRWSGPAHWLADWSIQGNSRVTIGRIAQGVDYRFIAAGQPGGVAARQSH